MFLRRFTGVCFLVLAIVLFASFSMVEAVEEPDFPDEIEGEHELTFWSWMPGVEEAVEAFEEKYPNVTVDHENVGVGPDHYDQLMTVIAAGDGAPDVTMMEYGYLPQFIDTGGIKEIGQFGFDEYEDYFLDWTWDSVVRDGEIYAIPWDQGPNAFMYRQDLFEEAGIDELPSTWEDFREAAEQLQEYHGDDVYIANFDTSSRDEFQSYPWQAEAQWFTEEDGTWTINISDPETQMVAEFWGEMIEDGLISTHDNDPDYIAALSDGEIAGQLAPSWEPALTADEVPEQEGKWRIEHMPQWEEQDELVSSNWGGSTTAVTTQSESPEVAAIFARWIATSKEANKIHFEAGGSFPVTHYGLNMEILYEPDEFYGGQVLTEIYEEAAEGVPDWQFSPWTTHVDEAFEMAFAQAVDGDIGWIEALELMEEEIEREAEFGGYDVIVD